MARRHSVDALLVVALLTTGCAPLATGYVPGSCPLPECSDWTYQRLGNDDLPIVGFHKGGRRLGRMTVYIEGDGNAWHRRSQVSSDPTPNDPVSLRLAIRDPDADVLYLARPCQYLGKGSVENCDPSLWTVARYSQDVVTAMDRAITAAKASPEDRLTLVGYSGGGVVATLVAAGRSDVDELITVAAPLDTVAWTNHHRVSALEGSLNPLDNLPASKRTRAFHFHGGRDRTVPPAVVDRYRLRASSERTRFLTLSEFTHQCCWVRDWRTLLSMNRKSGDFAPGTN